MNALIETTVLALNLYTKVLIASVIFSFLYNFGIINTSHQLVKAISDFLYKTTEPILKPIRNLLPDLGGIDISPIILWLIIFFIQTSLLNFMR
ncbi:Integral membrane protein YggT [Liberibacter crescens BT-1]|uniref:Integral membrane protein YggT n=1 Tax=Liberibacter crescens (strain BT-1) TaxID=1215343 RepID=L0EXC5_LIBCB|nr:YggT family protein [Liberibacter crescens]AGA65011.1 Integral membrane protein YggT [Liberibacter crescens BT-1]AMC13019.1 membrane protein [Liberibacter crescens]